MATTKAQQRAVNKYIGNHYNRINLTLPATSASILREAAEKETGGKVNQLISKALLAYLGLEAWPAEQIVSADE